ncbi:hypothetical protein [Oceaniglobus trochenteri]|uniref:hypothetical protein n=1 Tax=Oceaniglobus trochenteri TaxID=2763260 RepID=UPI001CFFA7B0|nr:hypothetical protein [Oceaniglobus trochenteri]
MSEDSKIDAKAAKDAEEKAKAEADAKAAKDAEAKVKADAEAMAAKEAEAQAVKDAAKVQRAETWRRLAARIAAEAPHNRVELIGDLQSREGLKLRTTSEGRTYAKMAGIEAGARGGEMQAVINWGNAARRALNAAG